VKNYQHRTASPDSACFVSVQVREVKKEEEEVIAGTTMASS
jgi:hypothetical protein